MKLKVKRGDVFYADLGDKFGSEQGGIRPVVIIQNDTGNKHSPTVIIAPITTKMSKHSLPTHIELSCEESGLNYTSMILLEQIRTIDKCRLRDKVTNNFSELIKKRINTGIKISLGVN